MKKIIPLISLLGASALVVGISTTTKNEKKEGFIQHFNSFYKDVENINKIDTTQTSIAMNKYALKLSSQLNELSENNSQIMPLTNNDSTLDESINIEKLTDENQTENNAISNDDTTLLSNEEKSSEIINNNIVNNAEEQNNNENNEQTINQDIESNENTEIINQVSTLYNLSNDIEQSCDDFCELKEKLSDAILETQNLINKVQNKEIELTNEQRLFITQQAQQLKNLGRQLSSSTTELSISLSDLNSFISTDSSNMDALSIKYLVVLDNLVNGNEMLQSGLETVNLMNQMFNVSNGFIPPNNTGRILYGFQQNNNPPIIKDFLIDENGELKQNNANNQDTETNNINEETDQTDNEQTAIDTYKNTKLKSNIDTYGNTNLPRNIDSFFNTALLDNDFMYGNGYNGMYGMANPYMQGYTNYERNNAINGDNNLNNTQYNNNPENGTKQSNTKAEKKRIKLKKNIDTYKDENEPDIKTKLGNIKNSISGFFSKFNKEDGDKKIENPVYRYNSLKEEQSN